MNDNREMGLFGVYHGTIINRDDPDMLGRVRVSVPSLIEPENVNDAPWAMPIGGGSPLFGRNDIPPVGATVYVMFVNGNIEKPVWLFGSHGKPSGQTEAFPEFDHPDVHVWGRGPFRLVVDNRAGQQTATLKIVRIVNGAESTTAAIVLNYETNSIQITADSAIGLESQAIVDIKGSVVQVLDRKIAPNGKVIN